MRIYQQYIDHYLSVERAIKLDKKHHPFKSFFGNPNLKAALAVSKKIILLCYVDLLTRGQNKTFSIHEQLQLLQMQDILIPGKDPIFSQGDTCAKTARRIRNLIQACGVGKIPKANTVLAELHTVFSLDELAVIFQENPSKIQNRIEKGDKRPLSPWGLILSGDTLINCGILGAIICGMTPDVDDKPALVVSVFAIGAGLGIVLIAAGILSKIVELLTRLIFLRANNKPAPRHKGAFSGTLTDGLRLRLKKAKPRTNPTS